jgi:TDG/mug DNA glycosylase family protein
VNGYRPDILIDGLDVVLCGINPAASAAADGHNFSHQSNRFWAVLHLAGFTDTRLRPEDEDRLLQFGCGITAVVARPTRRASEVTPEEFREARPAFEAKVRRFRPLVVAFLGKRAFSSSRAGSQADSLAPRHGCYPTRPGSTGPARSRRWCTPTPSFDWPQTGRIGVNCRTGRSAPRELCTNSMPMRPQTFLDIAGADRPMGTYPATARSLLMKKL